MKNRARQRGSSGSVRIIGGQWRGRKLEVGEQAGLRPTSDRTRETLFNWLQAATPAARVLDLFAGSGALGFEALSRGAAHATLIEKHKSTAAGLQQQAHKLATSACSVHCADAITWLKSGPGPNAPGFDLVFLDPPFNSGLLPEAVSSLEQGGWLQDDALIYAEFSCKREPATWPNNWTEIRRGGSREAACILFRRHACDQGAGP